MLERYYVRPVTVDRVRTSWIVAAIEQYVGWLAEWRYASRTVLRRIPLLVAFGEFAKTHQGRTFIEREEKLPRGKDSPGEKRSLSCNFFADTRHGASFHIRA